MILRLFLLYIKLSYVDLDNEISKAELVIPDGDEYKAVLVVACTRYEASLEKNFKGAGFVVHKSGRQNKLKEVILLNLTTPELRRNFCHLGNAKEMVGGLELLIEKTQGPYGFMIV
jgi:hypothetical protein